MSESSAHIVPEYRGAMPRASAMQGALIQTGAIFIDAYRELNHRKMFWLVLILSGVIVVAFAAVGIDDKGVTIFGKYLGIPLTTALMSKPEFYKLIYNDYAVQWWLGWGASILALISTAGIFPDLLTGGSVDLYLSKPISRLRLFFTKYSAALLFVALQVGVFSVASFIVIGIRAGVWLWVLFLAIPLVVCIFSYLYAVCTLIGVLTRSTLAALLLTILVWLAISIVSGTDSVLLAMKFERQNDMALADARIAASEKRIQQLEDAVNGIATTLPAKPATVPSTKRAKSDDNLFVQWGRILMDNQEKSELQKPKEALVKANADLQVLRTQRAEMTNPFIFWHDLAVDVKTVFPKTSETLMLLDRGLQYYADMPERTSASTDDSQVQYNPTAADAGPRNRRGPRHNREDEEALKGEMAHELMSRSITWVVGTSLGFEAVLLAIAAFVFVRRDY